MVHQYLKGEIYDSVAHANRDDNCNSNLSHGRVGSKSNATAVSDKASDSLHDDGRCFEMDSKTVECRKGEVVERENEVVRLPKAGE